jgi:peptidoglycan/xylan/chitin deacetylase (PgdA/CDA1 family)
MVAYWEIRMPMKRKMLSLLLTLGIILLYAPTSLFADTMPTKEVALTFDDGPYGTPTTQILDTLESDHVPATFFLIGKNVEEYPELARREVADGDLIGNHSYDHAQNLAVLSAPLFQANLDEAEETIASATGVHATIFRAPYGSVSPTMRAVLARQGYTIATWNVDPEDWNFTDSSSTAVVDRVLAHVQNNSIILLHDGRDTHVGYPRSNTVDALPILIADLKARGYTFVTVDKLLP